MYLQSSLLFMGNSKKKKVSARNTEVSPEMASQQSSRKKSLNQSYLGIYNYVHSHYNLADRQPKITTKPHQKSSKLNSPILQTLSPEDEFQKAMNAGYKRNNGEFWALNKVDERGETYLDKIEREIRDPKASLEIKAEKKEDLKEFRKILKDSGSRLYHATSIEKLRQSIQK